MDSNIVRALVAEFGLDLLKFNDDIRLGTLVPPVNCSKSTAADTENIKAFYAPRAQMTQAIINMFDYKSTTHFGGHINGWRQTGLPEGK